MFLPIASKYIIRFYKKLARMTNKQETLWNRIVGKGKEIRSGHKVSKSEVNKIYFDRFPPTLICLQVLPNSFSISASFISM